MCTDKQFKAEGKQAFHPDKNPIELNPYPQNSMVRAHDLWLEGWRETAIKHDSNYLNHVQCSVLEEYLSQACEQISCWQLARETDDFMFDCHVCQDCIVYKYAKPNDEINKQQIEKILRKRKILRTVLNIK